VGSRARQRLLFGAASVVSTAAIIAGCETTPDTSYVFMYGAPDVDSGAETGSGAPLYGLPAIEAGTSDAALYGGPIFEAGADASDGSDDAPTDAGSDADQ